MVYGSWESLSNGMWAKAFSFCWNHKNVALLTSGVSAQDRIPSLFEHNVHQVDGPYATENDVDFVMASMVKCLYSIKDPW